eukprot:5737029-Pyramimonas_sp.AAC.1
MGNRWADYVAKRGALEHAQPDTVVKYFEARLQDAKTQAKFFSWAAAKMAARDQLSARPEQLLRVPQYNVPCVALTEHNLVARSPQVFQCRECLAVARTQASPGKLLGTECKPTAQERPKARADQQIQRAPLMRSHA